MTQTTRSPRPINLADVLEAMADTVPDRTAIATLDRDWTFAEIDDRSTRLANRLIDLGIGPGEHRDPQFPLERRQ